MFEFRLRILGAGPHSYLGIVEGLPELLVHGATPELTEVNLLRGVEDWIQRKTDQEATPLQHDDLPTIRVVRLQLVLPANRPSQSRETASR